MHRDRPVYPGHPITLACQIATTFPDLEAAGHPTRWGWPAALSSGQVSGAGSSVYLGLNVLRMLRDGHPLDEVLAWADDMWLAGSRWNDAGYLASEAAVGIEQARRYLAATSLLQWVRGDESIDHAASLQK
jgi:hypothetical protein